MGTLRNLSPLVAVGFLSLGCVGGVALPDPSPESMRSVVADPPLPPPGKLRAETAAPVDPSPFLGQDWYGLYLHGEKIGCVTISVVRREVAGTSTIVCEENVFVRVVSFGRQVKGRMESRSVYAADGVQGLLEKRNFQEKAGQSVERIGTIEAGQFVVQTVHGTGEPTRQSFPLPKETLGDHLVAQVLARSGAPPGTKRKAFDFDLDDGKESKVTYEVAGTEDVFSGGVASKIVLVHQGRTKDRPLRLSSTGKYLELGHAGVMRCRLEPEDLAKDIRYSADLFLKGLLRPDRKLGPPQSVRALDLRLRGTEPALDLPSGGRQTVKREDDGALRVTLRIDVPRDLLPAASEKEAARYLRPTPEMPVDNEEIRKLAVEAAGDADSPEEKVRRFVRFVQEHIEDAIRLEAVSVIDLLRDRRGDCTEHTDLFLALCRASGIPARPVTGLMYAGDVIGGFGSHRWAEAAIDGRWVSADPTWGQFPVDSTHVAQGFGESMTNALKMLSGGITLEVVSIEAGP